jgi:hypothetical protein
MPEPPIPASAIVPPPPPPPPQAAISAAREPLRRRLKGLVFIDASPD